MNDTEHAAKLPSGTSLEGNLDRHELEETAHDKQVFAAIQAKRRIRISPEDEFNQVVELFAQDEEEKLRILQTPDISQYNITSQAAELMGKNIDQVWQQALAHGLVQDKDTAQVEWFQKREDKVVVNREQFMANIIDERVNQLLKRKKFTEQVPDVEYQEVVQTEAVIQATAEAVNYVGLLFNTSLKRSNVETSLASKEFKIKVQDHEYRIPFTIAQGRVILQDINVGSCDV